MSEMNQQPKSVKPKMPKIRFEGFSGNWEKYQLSEIVHQIRSYSLSRNVETEKNTGLKYIHYGDIHVGKASYLHTDENLAFINADSDFKVLQRGDLVLADASEDYIGIAEPCVLNFEPETKIVAGLHTIAIRPNKAQYSGFLYYYFNTKMFKKHCYRVGTGMKVFGITFSNLAKYRGYFPSLFEQTQIGNLLQELDKLIELQTRAVELAETHKKAMLQKMFPQKGEKAPKVRFEGFSGDWELHNLNDLVKINMGQSPDSENYTDNPEDKILVQGNADLYRGKVIPRIYTTQITKVAEKGDIILTVRAPVGAIAITDFDVVLGRGVAAIKGNRFIYYTLELFNLIGSWLRFSSGSTFDSINSNEIKQMPVMAPNKEEQTKIGNYFQELDRNIESEKKKLEQYQTMKRAMLQRMFV